MIGLIGIKKDTPLEIREKFSVNPKKRDIAINRLKDEIEEIVVLSTCNRTEIYFNHFLGKEEILKKIFEAFDFDKDYKDYVFISEGEKAIKHLFRVICGFHSKILGEDQILGQIKESYSFSLENKLVKNKLLRLFQEAITCGKRFRKEANLYQIPVSSASISVNKVIEEGGKKIMVLGYGSVGKLVVKNLISHKSIEDVYIVVRDKNKVDNSDSRIKVLDFSEKNFFINNMDGIISCTSAPHIVIRKEDLEKVGKRMNIYDLALPRDVDVELYKENRFKILDIDSISKIDDENKHLRKERMQSYKWIIDKYIHEYKEWEKLRDISPYINKIRENKLNEVNKRYGTYKNKSKEENKIVEKMIESMGNFYSNKAINVLKEEALKGREEECLEILKKIFF